MCLEEPNCNFFSHATLARSDYPACAVCGACDLTIDSVGQRFTSWLRGEQMLRLHPTRSASETTLAPLLQGTYSKQLYGAEGRVPLRSLRFVWLSLLQESSLLSLTSVGVCKANARPPARPFFWGIDTIANPLDASMRQWFEPFKIDVLAWCWHKVVSALHRVHARYSLHQHAPAQLTCGLCPSP